MAKSSSCSLLAWTLIGVATACVTSCGKPATGPNLKKVPLGKVEGTVTVDGNPEPNVFVKCVPEGDFPYKDKMEIAGAMSGVTDIQGKFKLTTYETGDGVPAGKYSLTFTWPPLVLAKKQDENETAKADRLKGKYVAADKSPLKITVEENKAQVLDPIDLSTK